MPRHTHTHTHTFDVHAISAFPLIDVSSPSVLLSLSHLSDHPCRMNPLQVSCPMTSQEWTDLNIIPIIPLPLWKAGILLQFSQPRRLLLPLPLVSTWNKDQAQIFADPCGGRDLALEVGRPQKIQTYTFHEPLVRSSYFNTKPWIQRNVFDDIV